MVRHKDINGKDLRSGIRRGTIVFGGNLILKIYGQLRCKSGRRMKLENRIFFESEKEAIAAGYRPCGHCMRQAYGQWKANTLE